MVELVEASFKHCANDKNPSQSNVKARAIRKELTDAAIRDLLFKEMRELEQVEVTRTNLATGEDWIDSVNKYDNEVDKYTNRIVFGDFSNPSTPKPKFRIDYRDFSDELKFNLAERAKCGKSKSLKVL